MSYNRSAAITPSPPQKVQRIQNSPSHKQRLLVLFLLSNPNRK